MQEEHLGLQTPSPLCFSWPSMYSPLMKIIFYSFASVLPLLSLKDG